MSSDQFSNRGDGTALVVRDPESLRLESQIAATRERVAQSVLALERELTRAVDWREWVRRRPRRLLGAAFVVGWLLGR